MAFGRVIELLVDDGITSFEVSGLDVTVNIERSMKFADNSAEFTIYNTDENVQENILKEKNTVTCKMGYEDSGVDTVFIGQIKESSTHPQGEDVITKIKAYSLSAAGININTNQSLSYSKNSSLRTVISDIAATLTVPVIGIELADINLSNGFSYAGRLRGALRQCKNILASNDKLFTFDNNSLVISDKSLSGAVQITLLDYNSGLKTVKKVNEELKKKNPSKNRKPKIQAETIMIPAIVPNSIVRIQTDKITGDYLVLKARYTADNFGGQFGINIEAEEVN